MKSFGTKLSTHLGLILTPALFLSFTAKADQAAYVTKEQAERAVALLKDKGEIKHYCAPCDDKSIRVEAVKTVEVAPTADAKEWEVKVNGTAIDLAYLYFPAANGQWKNAATELKIEVEGVPQFLPTAGTPATPANASVEVDDWETGGTSPQTSGEFFARANEFFRNYQFDKAIADYSEAIKMREDNAAAYLMRGTAQINKKNYDAALIDLNKALQLDGWEYLTHFRLAELYEAQGKKELGAQERQKGTARMKEKVAPRNAQEFLERGQYFDERGYRLDAIGYYSEAIKLDANFAPVYEKRAEAYDLSNKFDEALADYNKFIELQPQRVMSYVRRAEIMADAMLLGDGKKDYSAELLRDYSEVIKHADTFEWNPRPLYGAYIGRAGVYNQQGENGKAIADYSSALKLKPRDTTTFITRANILVNTKAYEKAIRDYDYALVLDPKSAWAYNGRGNAYKNLASLDKAMADYSKAIEISPRYTFPIFSRAGLYLDKGENDKAIEEYTKLIAISDKNANYFNNRGIAYNRKKEWDQALADFDQALKLNAKSALTWNNRGVVYKNKNELDKAIADYTQAITVDPTYVTAYTNRAEAYRKQNKNDLAEADDKKSQELVGKIPATPATPPPAGNFDDDDDFFFF